MSGIPKFAAEDTSLVTGNIHGEKTTVPVPKGTDIIIDTPGVHYNRTYLVVFIIMMPSLFFFLFFLLQNKTLSARYWKDPHTFNPSRFLTADWPRDAFMPFSFGEKWEWFLFFWHDSLLIHMKYMQDSVLVLVESIYFFFFKNLQSIKAF